MKCLECNLEIKNKRRKKFCSQKCNNKFHFNLWRKRNPEKVISRGGGNNIWQIKIRGVLKKECIVCGSTEKLDINHKKPKEFGGKDKLSNANIFCRKHHLEYHNFIKQFIIDLVKDVNFNDIYKKFINKKRSRGGPASSTPL